MELIFEKSRAGRRAGHVPNYGLPKPELPLELRRALPPRLPEVAEPEIVRHITALADRLHVPMSKVMVNLDRYGNTSAASVPVALDEARREGRIRRGDIVLLNAFGAGFAWGAAVIRF